MTIFKLAKPSLLRPFFDSYIADCTHAELKFNIPGIVILTFAAFCSKLNPLPSDNNLFGFAKNDSSSPPGYYNCTSDSIFQFAHFISKVVDFSGCVELMDVCKKIIDSPFSHCFIDKPAEAQSFCEKALPIFFELAFNAENIGVEGQKSKVESQRSKVESQRSKVESQRSKVKGRKSKVKGSCPSGTTGQPGQAGESQRFPPSPTQQSKDVKNPIE